MKKSTYIALRLAILALTVGFLSPRSAYGSADDRAEAGRLCGHRLRQASLQSELTIRAEMDAFREYLELAKSAGLPLEKREMRALLGAYLKAEGQGRSRTSLFATNILECRMDYALKGSLMIELDARSLHAIAEDSRRGQGMSSLGEVLAYWENSLTRTFASPGKLNLGDIPVDLIFDYSTALALEGLEKDRLRDLLQLSKATLEENRERIRGWTEGEASPESILQALDAVGIDLLP